MNIQNEIGNDLENKFNSNIKYNNKIFIILMILNFTVSYTFLEILIDICFGPPNLFHEYSINEYYNDYCENRSNEYYDFLCTNKYYKYNLKKSKFIWILTDGTASNQLLEIYNNEKYKIASFYVEVDDVTYKHTNELYSTLITGKHNRNYNGLAVEGDHIIQQMANAGYKINLRGWDSPMADLTGDRENGINDGKFYHKRFIFNEHEITAFNTFCNITNPFPFLQVSFDRYRYPIPNEVVNDDLLNKIKNIISKKKEILDDKKSRLELYNELDKLFEDNPINLFSKNINDCLKKSFGWEEKENISIIYYTTELDHSNHLFSKYHVNTVLQCYITEKMIIRLMEWIDNHEDYALIVTSDHGGQEFYGQDGIKNHGVDSPGNEAIFFVYTKEIKDHYDELKIKEPYIHMEDENEMIAQILTGINIPFSSRGFPHRLINDDINFFIALKRKEIQLIKLMEKYIEKYKNYENSLKDILEELKNNFSLTKTIIKTYISENLDIYNSKVVEFKDMINSYEKSLFAKQNEIMKIIDNNNRKVKKNYIYFSIIFSVVFIKFIFEIYFLFFRIIDTEKGEVNSAKKKKDYIFNVIIFISFFILSFYSCIRGNDIREGLIIYCFYYSFFICLICFHFSMNIFQFLNNNLKIIVLISCIFFFSLIVQNPSYPDYFLYLKKYLVSFSKNQKFFFNFFIYILLYSYIIIKESIKFTDYNYFVYIFKKKFHLKNLRIYYIIIIILLLIENYFKIDYLVQKPGTTMLIRLNFIFFMILWIISHKTPYKSVYNEENETNMPKYISLEGIDNIDDLHKLDRIKNISENSDNKSFEKNLGKGLPCIKIFYILIYFWISDESEKLFGLIIVLSILELLDYLSEFFNSKIKEFPQRKKKEDKEDLNFREILNYEIDGAKIKNNKNLYLYYFLFYILLQDMFLVINISSFSLMKYSFGIDVDSINRKKLYYAIPFVKGDFYKISKYKINFIILGFFLEKQIYDKNHIGQFELHFSIHKILLGLRINLDIIYFFYQMLININDSMFIELFIYCFINLLLLLMDYIGFIIRIISSLIKEKIFPYFDK